MAAGPWVAVFTSVPAFRPKPQGPWIVALTIGRDGQAVDEFCGATLS
ncbi:hypothetical protein EEDFHM_00052 [Methylorubrum populi]